MSEAALEIPRAREGVDWSVAAPLAVMHGLALLAPFTYSRAGLIALIFLYLVTGLGVTAGAHRLFTHRSYDCHPLVRDLLALAFLLAGQGSLRRWVRDHELHHRFPDEEGDPHSPLLLGVFDAHLGWLWRKPADERALYLRYSRNLNAGRIGTYFRTAPRLTALHLAFALLLFSAGFFAGGLGLGMSLVVWGVFLRMTLVLHSTLLVNSLGHLFGARRYPTRDGSRNNLLVALVALGEGFHNNHHHRPAAANNGFHARWELDLTWLFIAALATCGLASEVKVFRKGRMELWR